MEEKERYEYFFGTNTVKDNINKEFLSYKRVIDTLNQQDKELSKLQASYQQVKEENHQLKQQLAESERKLEEYKKCNCKECMTDYEKNLNQIIDKYLNENIKLKQQLHDLPNKIVEEITNELSNNTSLYFEIRESTSAHCPNKEYEWFNYVRFRNYINTILKKFGGEDDLR